MAVADFAAQRPPGPRYNAVVQSGWGSVAGYPHDLVAKVQDVAVSVLGRVPRVAVHREAMPGRSCEGCPAPSHATPVNGPRSESHSWRRVASERRAKDRSVERNAAEAWGMAASAIALSVWDGGWAVESQRHGGYSDADPDASRPLKSP